MLVCTDASAAARYAVKRQTTTYARSTTQSTEKPLQTLDQLLANGYITKQEYTERKNAILKSI